MANVIDFLLAFPFIAFVMLAAMDLDCRLSGIEPITEIIINKIIGFFETNK